LIGAPINRTKQIFKERISPSTLFFEEKPPNKAGHPKPVKRFLKEFSKKSKIEKKEPQKQKENR